MKIQVLDQTGKKVSDLDLPEQFSEPVRQDIIWRAILAEQSWQRQPHGTDIVAGQKASSEISRRRRDYRGSYGRGISRVQRKVMSRRGTNFNWVGATVSGTVKGRRAHPPKVQTKWRQKININEYRKALRSAISATLSKDLTKIRNHNVPNNYPFILDSKVEDMIKTKDVEKMLISLGFDEEIERTSKTKTRAGRGKTRGRRKIVRKGVLIVVSKLCNLLKAGRNIPGVDVVEVDQLTASALAPGGAPGRLALFTLPAIERMKREKLYLNRTQQQRLGKNEAKKK